MVPTWQERQYKEGCEKKLSYLTLARRNTRKEYEEGCALEHLIYIFLKLGNTRKDEKGYFHLFDYV